MDPAYKDNCSQPTYEELKPVLATESLDPAFRSQPTYEELKHEDPVEIVNTLAGSQPTYEELKPAPPFWLMLERTTFPAYL